MITSFVIIALMGAPNLQDLIDAKQWDAAEARLEKTSPTVRSRFEGLIAQGRGDSEAASKAFERALRATPGVPQLHLHAAHAYFQLKRFDDVLRHAQAAAPLRGTSIAQPLLEARALEGLGRDADAYEVILSACKLYKNEVRPWLELAVLAHRKALPGEVRRAAREVMSRAPDRGTRLSLLQLLHTDRGALPLLEEIAATALDDPAFRAGLAHAYAHNRRWYSAARLFEEAVTLGGDYAFEAADQYRMSGRLADALRMNGLATGSEAQRKQRVSILFEREQYARLVAMRFEFKDPATLYRIAYAYYAVGDKAGARVRARALLKTSYRDEAQSLLDGMGQGGSTPAGPKTR